MNKSFTNFLSFSSTITYYTLFYPEETIYYISSSFSLNQEYLLKFNL